MKLDKSNINNNNISINNQNNYSQSISKHKTTQKINILNDKPHNKSYIEISYYKAKSNQPISMTLPMINNQNTSSSNKKIEVFGPISKGMSKETYYIFNPPENFPYSTEDIMFKRYNTRLLNIIDNKKLFTLPINPYVKTVNQALYENNQECFGFKAKCLYEKALELSLLPKIAKIDEHNPIFFLSANPRDYKHYQD